jgi:acyl-CoA thioesterase FadM
MQIRHHDSGKAVVRGHTVHAFTDAQSKPIRPPEGFLEWLQPAAGPAES